MPVKPAAQKRPLSTIASEIRENWVPVHEWAEPYLSAMEQLTHITDRFFDDSAETAVRYFLSNAKSWRGETARRIKAELKAMVS